MTERVPEIRCPRLGHQVALAYCYKVSDGGPCSRLFICWEAVLPRLRAVVSRLLSPEAWRRYFETPPPSKIETLVRLAQAAKTSRSIADDHSGGSGKER